MDLLKVIIERERNSHGENSSVVQNNTSEIPHWKHVRYQTACKLYGRGDAYLTFRWMFTTWWWIFMKNFSVFIFPNVRWNGNATIYMKTHSERCGLGKNLHFDKDGGLMAWYYKDMRGATIFMVTVRQLATKLDGDCLYSDFDLFCDLMTLTFDLENQQRSVLSHDASLCKIWWRCGNAFVTYVWSSIRTDRQTDGRIYLPKCKFWQVMKLSWLEDTLCQRRWSQWRQFRQNIFSIWRDPWAPSWSGGY